MGLTIKQQNFCKEYVANGGKATEAYLQAYDSKSENSARVEASKLLERDDITECIEALLKPTMNTAKNERQKKRRFLWDMIQSDTASNTDKLRAMDILNKMDADYKDMNQSEDEKPADITLLDTGTLLRLVE